MDFAPHILPIYRDGRLQFFADVRTFIREPLRKPSSVSFRHDTETGSSSCEPSAMGATPNGAAAGAAFNLDACFKIGEGK